MESMIPAGHRILRGDRNQCPSCGLYFNSTYAFDKHITGKYGKRLPDGTYAPHTRRCRTLAEMEEIGMFESKGWWYSKRHPSLAEV